MKLASTKSSMDELDNSNNVLQASIQTFQIECEDLKKDRKRKVEEIERLHLQINQSQSALKTQHAKLTAKYTLQVEKMYQYTYRPCKQKHAIIEDFYTNDDFVIEDEGIIP